MAFTTGAFPYDINNLLGGAVAIYFGDADGDDAVDIPGDISDVITMTGALTPKDGWTRIGATKESFTSTRGFGTEGYEIQNVAGNVVEEITENTRTIELSIAEFRQDLLAMIEGGVIDTPVAGSTGISAQKITKFGSISSPKQYRFAYISRRPRQAGIVIEPGGKERTRMFMGCAYRAQIAADDVSMEQAKGALTAVGVTFTCFPEAGEAENEEYGMYADEQAGTIA